MARLEITPNIAIDESELDETFVLAGGPGGQNVNKVASAVQLRFDVLGSRSLPDEVRQRLIRLAGSRLTKSGELVLVGRRFRSQERNRADVRARLAAMLRSAARPPRSRRKTAPPRASKERRIQNKIARGLAKRLRSKPRDD
ncbi:MAG TPA: alternative ribosome rescue aminoacyl-tRNA hydrolase ArfB [Rhizomicrobium sp.]